MGTEIVFVLIYPVALICVVAAIWFWLGVAKTKQSTISGRARAYLPLIAGLTVSMAGLTLLAYIDGSADFTSLIQQGYYTEAERSLYLPRRIVGQAILSLVLVLPLICLVVTPMTATLIKTHRLNLGRICVRLVIGWVAFSFIGWLLSLGISPPYSLFDMLSSTAVPMLIYGLPIPLAALMFFRRKQRHDKGAASDCGLA
jgi:hypothetical protein